MPDQANRSRPFPNSCVGIHMHARGSVGYRGALGSC
ncbi:predicted protein [Plenodomus lingam JN3]|uniref:Predicted protein n=1 Tax=Leptosphaeria maculans (strain JN3 / isolate v23.1.3 / race Av1-4-5-6-7-8) TaxID=985895 RepID=E4ZYZ2_LEPMJ|nr:predicted protein [Plenodomus lingam JN3]CBX96427.1 predicted protein [Plenodomus lingam JN3]